MLFIQFWITFLEEFRGVLDDFVCRIFFGRIFLGGIFSMTYSSFFHGAQCFSEIFPGCSMNKHSFCTHPEPRQG